MNYFIGNQPSQWHTGVPTYQEVRYHSIYPGVDLRFHGSQRQLEYDFNVAPGADSRQIALDVTGARKVAIDSDGNAVLTTAAGDVVLHKPYSYQEIQGTPREVAAGFELRNGSQLAFRLGAYDRSQTLVIDPVITYSTFIGGSDEDQIYALALDSSGNTYVAGETFSVDYPLQNAFQSTNLSALGFQTGVVSEINSTGTALVFSTYLGGSFFDLATGIAVDFSGQIFVTGIAGSFDFPTTTNAFQTGLGGGGFASNNAFLTAFPPGGATLLYSSYLGGSVDDRGLTVTTDNLGRAYIGGFAASFDFPVSGNAFQPVMLSPFADGFFAIFDITQSGFASVTYSTFIGGSGGGIGTNGVFGDYVAGVALDSANSAYLTGATYSGDFPVLSGAFQTTLNGSNNAFAVKINTTTGAGVYSTYLGGNVSDFGNFIAVDSAMDAYVVGQTNSTSFPTMNPYQASLNGSQPDAFISEFNPGGSALNYSTFLGGSGGDFGLGITVDPGGLIYSSGSTFSTNFPTVNPTQASNASTTGQTNAFISVIDPTLTGTSQLVFSTYMGGSGASGSLTNGDVAYAIALDSALNIYVSGTAASSNFPVTTGVFQPTLKGLDDGFVAKLTAVSSGGLLPVVPPSFDFGIVQVGESSTPEVFTLTNNTGASVTITGITFSGTNMSDFSQTDTCSVIPDQGSCTINVTFAPSLSGAESASMVIVGTPSSPQAVPLTGTGSTSGDFTVSSSPTTITVTPGQSGSFTFTAQSTGGFAGNVSVSCTGAPAGATCAPLSSSITVPADGSASTTVNITTTAPGAVPAAPTAPRTPGAPMSMMMVLLAAMLLCATALVLKPSLIPVKAAGYVRVLGLVVGLGLIGIMSACGSSGGGTGGTPAGTYTLTVTAASGALSHTSQVTLTVN